MNLPLLLFSPFAFQDPPSEAPLREVPVLEALSAEVSFLFDASSILSGGAREGEVGRGLLDIVLALDLDAAAGIPGATVGLNAYSHAGRDGSQLAGDLQAFSNIDGPRAEQIAELWWEQRLLDGALRIKLGKVDANSEFAYVEGGVEFLNSSFGFSPTVNGFPSYPNPSTSLNLFWYGETGTYAGLGIYDGAAQSGTPTGKVGPGTFLGSPSDQFSILEVGRAYDHGLAAAPGRIAFGAWVHDGDFERFDAGNEDGTSGLYLTWDQSLDDGPEATDWFVQVGVADPEVSAVETHLSTGLVWTDPLGTRPHDSAGLATTWALLSSQAGLDEDYEAVVEAFYELQLGDHVSLKPNLQYIANPGGSASLEDVIVFTLRIELGY